MLTPDVQALKANLRDYTIPYTILVKWLRQTAHDQEVVGSNPGTVYWMDVSHLLAITLKKN
jgi:hypothetical protein